VLSLLSSIRRRPAAAAGDDPWGGHTLEWATASPPVPANFSAPVPAVTSATPLLDEVPA
jgi:cytochrome c oxidase subunit 1